MTTRETEVTIVDVPEQQRFEASIDGELVGLVTYVRADDWVRYEHTIVLPAYEGRGIGSLLARTVLEDARHRAVRAIPTCPFIRAWIARHPEFA